MARKKAYLGKADGCQKMEAWLAEQQRNLGTRAFYEKGMAANPHLMPCPEQRGWWIYREACNHCPWGRREA